MKVLITSANNFSYSGGISNVILNYYNSMNNYDVNIDFLVKKCVDNKLKKFVEDSNSSLYELDYRIKSPLKYIYNLTKIIKKGNYDIVHAHGNSRTLILELYAAKMAGVKVVIPHSHNTNAKYKKLHKMLRPLFVKNYTYAFSCGLEAGKWLFGNKPFTVIKNGIDINKFLFNEESREFYRDKYNLKNKKVIGNVGTFNYQKNHSFLIDIFYEVYKNDDSYRLLIVGDGSLKEEIYSKIERLGLSDVVIFTGIIREVPQILQAIDILIMPSRYEGLPLSLVEAQAAGLPCIISDVITSEVKATDLITYVSLSNNSNYWSKVVLNTPIELRESRKENIKEMIINSGYDINTNALELIEIYNQLLSAVV